MFCFVFFHEAKGKGEREAGKAIYFCREQTLTLLYLKGKEAPQLIHVVAATPNLAHLWARAKEESDTELASLVNEESLSTDTSAAELQFFLPGNLLVCLCN